MKYSYTLQNNFDPTFLAIVFSVFHFFFNLTYLLDFFRLVRFHNFSGNITSYISKNLEKGGGVSAEEKRPEELIQTEHPIK